MDVTSILEVNHVKIMCYVIDLCVVFICCIYQLSHGPCLQFNVCMRYSVYSTIEDECKLKPLSILYKSLSMFQLLELRGAKLSILVY